MRSCPDLPQRAMQIVAVSVCCSVSSSNAGDLLLPARLLFRTKGGYAHVLGSGGSRFTGSDDAVLCGYRREDVPQPWEAVPAGFMLGGLVAERAANASTFSRVGFVFVAGASMLTCISNSHTVLLLGPGPPCPYLCCARELYVFCRL